MCWHDDQCSGRNVKGINFLHALYYSGDLSIPVAFDLVKKPIQYRDIKTRKGRRKSEITKNEMRREMITACVRNALKFHFVLFDSCFSFPRSKTTDELQHQTKTEKMRFSRIDEIDLPENTLMQGWLKGDEEPLLFVRQVFKKKTEVQEYYIWFAVIYAALTTQSPRPIKSGGKWRYFINLKIKCEFSKITNKNSENAK